MKYAYPLIGVLLQFHQNLTLVISIYFFSPGGYASVELKQFDQLSPFNTAQEAVQAIIDPMANDVTIEKFKIVRPVECSKYTFNGLPACSAIYQFVGEGDKHSTVSMLVQSLGPIGEDFMGWYRGDTKSFNHYLPIAESIIRSFKTAEDYSRSTDEDFGLEESAVNLNSTGLSNMSGPATINATWINTG